MPSTRKRRVRERMKSTGMTHEAAVHSLRESTGTEGDTGTAPAPTMFDRGEAQHDVAARLLVRHYLTTPEGRAKILSSMRGGPVITTLGLQNPDEYASRVQRLRVIMRGIRKEAAEDTTGILQGIDAMESELKAQGFDMSLPVDTGESFDSGTVTETQTMPGFGYIHAPGIDCANYEVVRVLSPFVEEAAGRLERNQYQVARLEVTPKYVRAYAKRSDGSEPGSEQAWSTVDHYVDIPLPEGGYAKLRGISRLPRVPWPVSVATGPIAQKLAMLDERLFDTPERKVAFLNVVDYADVRKFHGKTGTNRFDPCSNADLMRIGFQGDLRASTAVDETTRSEIYVSRLIPQGFAYITEAPANAVHAATLPEDLNDLVVLFRGSEILASPVKIFTRTADQHPPTDLQVENRGHGAFIMEENGQGITLLRVPKNIYVPFFACGDEHAIEERLYALFDADSLTMDRDSEEVETYKAVFEALQRGLREKSPITHVYVHKRALSKLLPHLPPKVTVVSSNLVPVGIAYATVDPALAGGVVRHEDGRVAVFMHVGTSARVRLPV